MESTFFFTIKDTSGEIGAVWSWCVAKLKGSYCDSSYNLQSPFYVISLTFILSWNPRCKTFEISIFVFVILLVK